MNRIVLNKKRNTYIVYVDKKRFTYSISRYDNFAYKLAQLSLKNKIKYYDYYIPIKNSIFILINTKAYGLKIVIIDKNNLDIIKNSKVSIYKDNHAHTFYASTKYGKLHRLIMKPKCPSKLVDHINRNGLDNRKCNLRIVSTSINNRNSNLRVDNKTGIKGISENDRRFRVYWYDKDCHKHSKSFSKTKYGYQNAKQLAINFRLYVEQENNYLS